MKKIFCIILACFMLLMVPVKGYAVSAPLPFGIGEEIILPFLMSLLGVQRASEVQSYEDLASYNDDIYDSLIESLSGLAGMEVIQEWLFKAVNGLIETDSIVWEKLQEIAIGSYAVASSDITIPADNIFSLPGITYASDYFTFGNNYYCQSYGDISFFAFPHPASSLFNVIACSTDQNAYFMASYSSSTRYGMNSSYTYDGKIVYYGQYAFSRPTSLVINDIETNLQEYAWLSTYGGYVPAAAGVGTYSDAFSEVLTSQEKEDIIDGTSVIQLYNPAELQNGLEIIPGGDPEDDPNLRKIPFAVTADWWNFLQQFGKGSGNQYVNAYNALNGLDSGASIGRISDAYESLGIASVGAAAAAAAEGVLNLTDSNIYPQSESVADTITNTIPSNLTPVTPDSGIDNESEQGLYKLPDLRDYFPFCIPFDLIDLLGCFVAEPETPEFIVALSTGTVMAQQNFDLHIWDNIASMVRTFELLAFILGLIMVTRNLIRG